MCTDGCGELQHCSDISDTASLEDNPTEDTTLVKTSLFGDRADPLWTKGMSLPADNLDYSCSEDNRYEHSFT